MREKRIQKHRNWLICSGSLTLTAFMRVINAVWILAVNKCVLANPITEFPSLNVSPLREL
jgi:hypothetical protein